ncbi:copper chaperone [Coemansia sp. Benny D115]|nr:copper chaperone [Coemansia sp. Benny D115]
MAGIKVQLAVDMTCQSCVDDVQQVLGKVAGVDTVTVSLADKQVVVEGTMGPSAVLKALKATGRAAVVRGAGSTAGGNIGAAVCIFEEGPGLQGGRTRGLARFVQIDERTCFVDVTVSGIADGPHGLAIHECGDLSSVPESCGGHWDPEGVAHGDGRVAGHRGDLGNMEVREGWGDLCFETDRFCVWEVIGRSMVVGANPDDLGRGVSAQSAVDGGSGPGILAGVIARSAGLFENDKQVCACSGNTLWTEQRLVDEGRRL